MLASLSGVVASHGVYAVFGLMVAAAIVPAASELVMLYAGAVAGGAFAATQVHVLGADVGTGAGAYVALAIAGVLGNTVGAAIGWWIGRLGGRPLLERYGRFLHVNAARIDRADRWFGHFGSWAVPLGLTTPVVRSFVAIPAGMFGVPFGRFLALALLGAAVFCFGLAGAGWALGAAYEHAKHALHYADYVVAALIVLLAVYLFVRRRRSTTMNRRASDTAR